MKPKFNTFLVILLVVIAAGILIYAKNFANKNHETSKDNLTGTIRVSGAWALYPIMVTWGQEFEKIHPNIKVEVSAGGAGKGVTDALSGMVDIGMVSREIKKEEIAQGGVFVPVVKDAVFVTVSKNNPVISSLNEKGMTKSMFLKLWINGTQMTWGEIAGINSQEKVNVYTRSDSCGAADTWAKYLGGTQENLKGIAVYGDPGIAEAAKQDNLGIAYNNLNYAYDLKTGLPVEGLAVVAIDVNGNGKVDPEEDASDKGKALKAVDSGVYPSPPARDLYLITKDSFKSPTKEFVQWILTDGQKYVDTSGYIKLKDAKIAEALKKI